MIVETFKRAISLTS